VIRPEHPLAALQSVLAEGAGRLPLAHQEQRNGEDGRHPQGDGMVGAEHPAAALQSVLAQHPGRLPFTRHGHGDGESGCRHQRGRVVCT
jgi:hypothetical protein